MRQQPILSVLAEQVFVQRGIRIVAQLRIETDWQRHSAETIAPTASEPEDYNASFSEILAKIKASLKAWDRGVYVVCDEAALPVSKQAIRDSVAAQFGIELFWKSDLLPDARLSPLTVLDLSLLDFEMALQAPIFVGLTRSTFSNMVTFERYARTQQPVTSHYVYNLPGPQLGLRTDNGAYGSPALATIL